MTEAGIRSSEGQWYYLVPDPEAAWGRLKIAGILIRKPEKMAHYLNQFTGGNAYELAGAGGRLVFP